MQHPKQIIQLSDHVKNKIRSHQVTPFSFSSDELNLSDNTENDSLVSLSPPPKSYRRRSGTFITYQIKQPSESESFFTDKRTNSERKRSISQQQLCQECLRRENLLRNEHQRLLRINDENKKLDEQLRSSNSLNRQYQEENAKLKNHLTKLSYHLREYQINFDRLKQKTILEKNNKSKHDVEINQLKRLRHELQVYNQVIQAKRQEEQKQIDYFSYRYSNHKK